MAMKVAIIPKYMIIKNGKSENKTIQNIFHCYTQAPMQKQEGKMLKFKAGVNIIAKGGLIPIKFAEHYIDEKLMSPKKGKPVLVHLNRFTGWSAEIELAYVDNIYSIEQIVNII